ncbi:hypothetical protein GCM10028827_07830 [Mucilaginibacter myungsuensis]
MFSGVGRARRQQEQGQKNSKGVFIHKDHTQEKFTDKTIGKIKDQLDHTDNEIETFLF